MNYSFTSVTDDEALAAGYQSADTDDGFASDTASNSVTTTANSSSSRNTVTHTLSSVTDSSLPPLQEHVAVNVHELEEADTTFLLQPTPQALRYINSYLSSRNCALRICFTTACMLVCGSHSKWCFRISTMLQCTAAVVAVRASWCWCRQSGTVSYSYGIM
jgi:hypothetical protein